VTKLPQAVGVIGAGTMGAGIAQLAVLAGFDTHLHDPFPEALERAGDYIHRGLRKGVERERWTQEEADEGERRLVLVDSVDELYRCQLVIEAAPERTQLKRDLFEQVSEIVPHDCVLATNTSSILVSSLAGAARFPENVVGMHFFNPPPLMRLLEVIAAQQTGEHALEVARTVGEKMGKQVIVASDGPGFLVNRCGRPYGGEALRLLQERVATVEQIDRVCRLGGGFRMGPFELMDLVGIDVGFEVAKSFHEQSFGEPRWRPSPLQARMVAAGRLGRKTGRGWYEYPRENEDPEPAKAKFTRPVEIVGESAVALELRERAEQAGIDFGGGLVVNCDGSDGDVVLCADRSLGAHGARCGFHLLPPLGRLVELTGERDEAVESFFATCGFHPEWVGDGPGLVLGRIVCQLVNEAAFAIGEGVGSAADVDAGVTLGLNHPRGPVEWGELIGMERVLATIDGLFDELRDPRYRAAPRLRHWRAVQP
jgi:3-hydroxybutyryl-CoA dehydrogenase